MREILKNNGLDDSKVEAILNAMKEAKIYTSKNENIDERYSKLKAQKTDLETQLKDRDNQLKDLSKNNKDNEELLKQIEQLQLSNKQTQSEYESKISKMEFDFALDKSLSSVKAKDNKLLRALLDMDNIKYQEGKLEGLEKQIEAIKSTHGYLFEEEKITSTGSVGNFGRSAGKVGITKEQFSKMNYQERNNLYKENKDLYLELSK